MTDPVLILDAVDKSFGEARIIRSVSLEVERGEKHAVIGPNGAGKSTLFHLCSGQLTPTKGRILLDGASIGGLPPHEVNHRGLARSFQITNIFPGLSVFENLRLSVLRRRRRNWVFWRGIAGLKETNRRTEEILAQVRLTARAHDLASALSYSEQRALEIGMTVASDPQVILLDEPMAGMSHEETAYAISLIREIAEGRTLMIVEHDMDVVFSLADRISVLVYGEIVATGTPERIRADARVREAYLGEEAA
ncbi:MAG: ABC transporter ATP-binding protein [Pseudomonadota bacterium]|nr:ABC transporter ATP-binding protein [Pseudomonadota bacterium]MEE3100895.1 ABC transporter ATP-binding protein [Pseudomonadota bacterium]